MEPEAEGSLRLTSIGLVGPGVDASDTVGDDIVKGECGSVSTPRFISMSVTLSGCFLRARQRFRVRGRNRIRIREGMVIPVIRSAKGAVFMVVSL